VQICHFQSGYFETHYQDKPWFVMMAGAFASRSQADAEIAKLPAGVRELKLWVRAAAGIKSSCKNSSGPQLSGCVASSQQTSICV
tara:strand:- start:1876 stop:2130 length:255 start_codon:yes stop_codon:yes gene_type:complete